MKFFHVLLAVALFLLPRAAEAAGGKIEHAVVPAQTPGLALVLELPRRTGDVPFDHSAKPRFSLEPTHQSPWETASDHPAFPLALKKEIDHLTSFGNDGLRYSLIRSWHQPGFRLRYSPDRHHRNVYEVEVQKDSDGRARIWATAQWHFF